jgi:hypothetical protein
MSNKIKYVPPVTENHSSGYGFDASELPTRSHLPVVVFFPSGNYNQLTELGRYKNLEVAMKILSSINHPDNAFQIPEYKIFSLETGTEIFVH